MNVILAIPIILPLFTLVLMGLLRSLNRIYVLRANLVGCLLHLIAGVVLWKYIWQQGTQALQVGDWPSPFGIVLVADLLSATMVCVTGFVGFCIALYIFGEAKENKTKTQYGISYQTLLMGVSGSFLTGDIFNLYVWFEVMLMSSFVLIAFEKTKKQLEGALKYTILNLVASSFFLIGIGLIYSAAGTLNMAHLSEILSADIPSAGTMAAFIFLTVAFGMKAGIFPLFFWLPASYHTPRIATSALLAGLLTKVGVYSLFRITTLVFVGSFEFASNFLLIIACLTMITGVLGAVYHYEIRKILSFHIISQIGYMIVGLAIGTPLAIAAGIFYVIHHIIVKTNLFLISGIIKDIKGTTDLKLVGSLSAQFPILAILFLIPAMSLAGMPPLSGFFAKFSLIKSGILAEENMVVLVALVVGLLTLLSMLKIWNEAFWKIQPKMINKERIINRKLLVPVGLMAAVTLTIGIWPEALMMTSNRISEELLNPKSYTSVVLKGSRP